MALEPGPGLRVLLENLNIPISFEKQGQGKMLQRVETSSDGAVFWVAMVRVCPAVLCCNSLRNTMARVYSSADL